MAAEEEPEKAKNRDFVEFLEEIKAARASGQKMCLDGIMQAGLDGKWQAFAWILERRYGFICRTENETKIEHKVDYAKIRDGLEAKLDSLTTEDEKG